VTRIITDSSIDDESRRAIEKLGVELLIASPDDGSP
jgi:hypothetical protein